MKIRTFGAVLASSLVLSGGLWGAAENGGRALADAAMQGDRDAVRLLLRQKADVNAAQGDGMTALHWAAFKDDVELAKMLLAAGANAQAATRDGAITPLFLACTNGSAAMIEALLKAGVDAKSVKADGTTALMAAASSGSVDAVRVLLARGADVNAKEASHGQTAVMFAAALNRDGVVRMLAAKGADLDVTTAVVKLQRMRYDEDGNPLGPAEPGKGGDPVAAANRAGTSAMGGMTALLYAARDGQLAAARALVESGADVNRVSAGDKTSPLVMAAENGHYTLAKYLVEHKADPNLASEQGLAALYATVDAQWAPLGWAPNPISAQENIGYLELMKSLLEHGADPNARLAQKLWFRPLTHDQQWIGPAGSTAFWRAAQSTDVEAMRLLATHGADPNIPSLQGDTPLMVAAGMGWGANFTLNAPNSWLPAVKYMVEELHADVNAVDSGNYTALHGAGYRGDNDVVQFLAEHGARMDVKSRKGQYATDMANGAKVNAHLPIEHPDTIALLEKLGTPAPVLPTAGEPVERKARPAAAAPPK